MFCEKCGANLPNDAKFCERCGTSVVLKPMHKNVQKTSVQIEGKKNNSTKKRKTGVIIGIIAAVVLLLVGALILLKLLVLDTKESQEESITSESEFTLGDSISEEESDFFDTYEFEIESENVVDNEAEIDLESSNSDIVDGDTVSEEIEQEYIEDEYILPGSDTRYITISELEELTEYECRLARNEIYARRGRIFNDPALQAYFNSKSWYEGTISADNFSENMLNEIERANVKTIASYEESKGY